MIAFNDLVWLIVACLAVNLSPGPSIVYVSSVTLAHGFRAGLFSVLGMSVGAAVHVILAASGLAALLATSPLLMTVIRYCGAAWLVYLGFRILMPGAQQATEAKTTVQQRGFFQQGVIVDTLNPKIALFFIAFFPQFLPPATEQVFLPSLAIGSVFLLTGFLVNSSIAWLVARGRTRISAHHHWLTRWAPGVLIIALGLRLLFEPFSALLRGAVLVGRFWLATEHS